MAEFTEILLPNGEVARLKNHKNYQERLNELYTEIPYIEECDNCFEKYWVEKNNKIERVKLCLDYLATYLLCAEDSGIKHPILY